MNVVSVEWVRPGCGERCVPRRHDPDAHEAHGFHLALMAQRVEPVRIVKTGPLVVDLENARTTVHGMTVALSGRERSFLDYLARRAGQACLKDNIVRNVWGMEYINPFRSATGGWRTDHHLIHVTACRVRRKLGDAGALIVSVKGSSGVPGALRLEMVEVTP